MEGNRNTGLQMQPADAGVRPFGGEDGGGGTAAPELARIGYTDPDGGGWTPVALPAADIVAEDGATAQARMEQVRGVQEKLGDHAAAVAPSETGVHGFRFNFGEGRLEYFNPVSGGFEGMETGGGNGGGGGTTKPAPIRTYGVRIDLNNSNPYTSVTYTDDATGMVGGSDLWDLMPIFRDIRPCLFKGGKVVGYLDPNDYAQWAPTQDLTGLPAAPDITSGDAGDVMVEFPKVGWRIRTTGDNTTVQVTNEPDAGDRLFCYYAHTRETEGDRDFLYVGAYKGSVHNDRLRSISGAYPTMRFHQFLRTAAHANGAGYDQTMFYPVTLLQILYLIRFKNLDSQRAVGTGFNSRPPNATGTRPYTGGANTRGMNWGAFENWKQVKCLGVEDLWGSLNECVDGLTVLANRSIVTAFRNFNDAGEGYTNRGLTVFSQDSSSSQNWGWISRVLGDSERGFLIKEGKGSSRTFFSDNVIIMPSMVVGNLSLCYFGGSPNAGIFRLFVVRTHSTNIGGRLMYL